jgi:hypothetical protein
MQPRYKTRISIRFPVRFTSGREVGNGQVLDLTSPGCLIESPLAVRETQSLQLELCLPGLNFPLSVPLGIVRWTKGKRFGVEFIKMHVSQQRILWQFLVEHCPDGLTRDTAARSSSM